MASRFTILPFVIPIQDNTVLTGALPEEFQCSCGRLEGGGAKRFMGRLMPGLYSSRDSGLNTKGELLIFETNASAVVNPPDEGDNCACRLSARQRMHAALEQMLMERAGFPGQGR